MIDRFRALGIDGVEAFYVTHTAPQTELLAERCAELGLLSTGSSDFHGPDNRLFSRFLAFETYGLEPNLGPIAAEHSRIRWRRLHRYGRSPDRPNRPAQLRERLQPIGERFERQLLDTFSASRARVRDQLDARARRGRRARPRRLSSSRRSTAYTSSGAPSRRHSTSRSHSSARRRAEVERLRARAALDPRAALLRLALVASCAPCSATSSSSPASRSCTCSPALAPAALGDVEQRDPRAARRSRPRARRARTPPPRSRSARPPRSRAARARRRVAQRQPRAGPRALGSLGIARPRAARARSRSRGSGSKRTCWQREAIVASTSSRRSLSSIRCTNAGGSSSVFSSRLAAWSFIVSTASITNTRRAASNGVRVAAATTGSSMSLTSISAAPLGRHPGEVRVRPARDPLARPRAGSRRRRRPAAPPRTRARSARLPAPGGTVEAGRRARACPRPQRRPEHRPCVRMGSIPGSAASRRDARRCRAHSAHRRRPRRRDVRTGRPASAAGRRTQAHRREALPSAPWLAAG